MRRAGNNIPIGAERIGDLLWHSVMACT